MRPVRRGFLRGLFGYDVFISYSQSDGTAYAGALEARLVESGLRVFIDHKGMAPGDVLPESLGNALRSSRMLVVVGTDGARDSKYVQEEVRVARDARLRTVIIDVGGSLFGGVWDEVRDLLRIVEPGPVDQPSEEVVGRVLAARELPRVRAVAAILLYLSAEQERERAERERERAETERATAEQRLITSMAQSLAREATRQPGERGVWLASQAYRLHRRSDSRTTAELDRSLRAVVGRPYSVTDARAPS